MWKLPFSKIAAGQTISKRIMRWSLPCNFVKMIEYVTCTAIDAFCILVTYSSFRVLSTSSVKILEILVKINIHAKAESESIHKLISFSVSNFYIHRDSDNLYIFSQLNSAAMRKRYHDFWWVSFAHPRCHCFKCEKRLMSQRKVVNYCSITSFNAVPIIVASLFIFDACINAYLIIHFTAIPVACCECYVKKRES